MNHCLQVIALGRPYKIDITSEEYLKLKRAKGTLTSFYNLTENYRIVVESYRAIERAKHEAELDHMLYTDFGYSSNTRVALNSPIIGYLSSSRYFLDSTDKILGRELDGEQFSAYQSFRSNLYDTIPEYAFIEALRNYVQHRELPIHNITYHNYVEDRTSHATSDMVVSLSLTASKETLAKDKKFKKAVLTALDDKINIVRCIRHHMGGLWALHDYLLQNHPDMPIAARTRVADTIAAFGQQSNEDTVGLYAIVYESENEITEKVPLLLDWDDARREAIRRLGNLKNLHRCYVSGKNK